MFKRCTHGLYLAFLLYKVSLCYYKGRLLVVLLSVGRKYKMPSLDPAGYCSLAAVSLQLLICTTQGLSDT